MTYNATTLLKSKPFVAAVAGTLLVLAAVTYFANGGTNGAELEEESGPRQVEVQTVAALSLEERPLVVLGEVRSQSEAELRALKSGRITEVYVRAGQSVAAGTVLASIENAAERAAVLSAQGSVAAAEAALARVTGGNRPEEVAVSEASLERSESAIRQAREELYGVIDRTRVLALGAVRTGADPLFRNPDTNPEYGLSLASGNTTYHLFANAQTESRLAKERLGFADLFAQWEALVGTRHDPLADAAQAEGYLLRLQSFFTLLSDAVAERLAGDGSAEMVFASYQGSVTASRSTISNLLAELRRATDAYQAALDSRDVVARELALRSAPARSEDVSAQQATVTQARGGLAAAQASLENTLVRTPISGEVSSLSVSTGDFVSAGSPVAVVANDGGLVVEAFISPEAKERVAVGNSVLIQGMAAGRVTSVASGLDPETKKVRITTSLEKDASLVHGQFVEVAITRSETTNGEAPRDTFFVPLTAVKVLPNGFVVFTVNEQGMLVAHPIGEGPVVGDKMALREGVTPDMAIVVDVRGLREGEMVTMGN